KSLVSSGSHVSAAASRTGARLKAATAHFGPARITSIIMKDGLYHLRAMYRHEGHGVRRRVPGRLYSPAEGGGGLRRRGNALYSSRRMYRLRGLRAGLSRRGDFLARRDPKAVGGVHREKRGVLSRSGLGIG